MVEAQGDDQDVIDKHMESWQQGDYVKTDELPFLRFKVRADGSVIIDQEEALGFLVSSQTCDVVRSCSIRPTVELVPLTQRPAVEVREVKFFRRPRYLFVPALEAEHLVADLDRPIVVDKQVLLRFQPMRGCFNPDEQARMARALARKYDRFAFPNEFNDFVKPLVKRFTTKNKKPNSEEGQHLRAIEEIRVAAEPNWNATEISLLFYLVLGEPYAGANWDAWTQEWKTKLSVTPWITEVNFQPITFADMSARDYIDSHLLDLENLSLPRD